jgi:trigger factor
LQQELSREGMSFEEFLRFGNKTAEEYREELKPDAERRLRNSLVLEAFAKAENVEVSEEDLLAEIDRLVGPSENAEQMRELYSNPYFSNMLRDELANRKVADRLLEIVTEGVGAVTGEGATVFDEPAAADDDEDEDDEELLSSEAESSEDDAESDEDDEADDDVEATAAADTEAEEAAVAASAADDNDTSEPEPTGS